MKILKLNKSLRHKNLLKNISHNKESIGDDTIGLRNLKSNKPRNNGEWTEARYQSFIKSALRAASQRWPPRYAVIKAAFVGKRTNPASGRIASFYKCNACKNDFPLKDVQVNHIIPVVPVTGFTTWDEIIERLFCEQDGLELLCKPCHSTITKSENEERKKNK